MSKNILSFMQFKAIELMVIFIFIDLYEDNFKISGFYDLLLV